MIRTVVQPMAREAAPAVRGARNPRSNEAAVIRSAAAKLAGPAAGPEGSADKARRYETWSAGGAAPDRASKKASVADSWAAKNARMRAELAADVSAAQAALASRDPDSPPKANAEERIEGRQQATQRFMNAQTRLATINALRNHAEIAQMDRAAAPADSARPEPARARKDATLGIFGDGGIFDFDYSDDEDTFLDGSIFDDPKASAGGSGAPVGPRGGRRRRTAPARQAQPAPAVQPETGRRTSQTWEPEGEAAREAPARTRPDPRDPARPGKKSADLNGNADDLVSFMFCSSAYDDDAESSEDDEPVELDEDDGVYILGYRVG